MAAAVQTIPLSQLPSWIANLENKIIQADFAPAWKKVGVLLAASMKANFDKQSDPNGTPWVPIKQYRARGAVGGLRQGKILRDRGLLMAGATGKGPNAVRQESPRALIWGSNLEYAGIHQYGGTIRPTSGRALAIPLTREAYRAGSPKNFPRPLHVVWPKGRTSGWLVEDKPGAVRRRGAVRRGGGPPPVSRGARSILHYKLASKVVIPARPFIGVNPPLIEKIEWVLLEHIAKLLRRP
jgi:phage virion morphogenesis protein